MSTEGDEVPVGDNVGRIRRRRGLSQEALAQRAGVSVGVVRKLERGERVSATLTTLRKLATALEVATVDLFRPVPRLNAIVDDTSDRDDLYAIRRALQPPRSIDSINGITFADDEVAPSAEAVRDTARETNRMFRDNDYAGAVAMLPTAVADARRAAAALEGADGVVAWTQLAQILQTAALVLTQLSRYDLAYHAVGLAMDAGRSAGDPVLVASAVNGENWLLTRQGRFDEAARGSLRTAEAVEPSLTRSQLSHVAIWGWLNLGAAAAAARNAQPDVAADAMRRARAAAEVAAPFHSTEVAHWTTFNPAVVAMREAELAIVLGQPHRTLDTAPTVPPDAQPRVTYQRFQLDLAAAHLELRQQDEALGLLRQLWSTAPGWLRHQRYGRTLAARIASSRRTIPADLRQILDCLGVDS